MPCIGHFIRLGKFRDELQIVNALTNRYVALMREHESTEELSAFLSR